MYGIDHTARAKGHVTFLDPLYIPEDIPAGVCIVIVSLRWASKTRLTELKEHFYGVGIDWLKEVISEECL